MANTLQELLELASVEPAYGPAMFRCLLTSDVYALRPARGHRVEDGVVRFVTWNDPNGVRILPCFTSRAIVRRVLTPTTEAYKLPGRLLLEATRGAIVVLNPNEAHDCRLSAHEITQLLETGAVSSPELTVLAEETRFAFEAIATPPVQLIHSLTLLYAQHSSVLRAYLVCFWPENACDQRTYLIVICVEGSKNTDQLIRETATVVEDVKPDLATDVVTYSSDDSATWKFIEELAPAFYDHALRASFVALPSARPS